MSDTVRWIKQRPTLTWVRFMGVIVIVSFALSGWTVVRQSQAAAERAADKRAANTSQVARCYQQVRDSPDVLKILSLIDTLATNSILVNREALELGGDDPLRPIRRSSLRRLVPARKTLRAFIDRSTGTVPTLKSCDQLAASLQVDPKPFRNKS